MLHGMDLFGGEALVRAGCPSNGENFVEGLLEETRNVPPKFDPSVATILGLKTKIGIDTQEGVLL